MTVQSDYDVVVVGAGGAGLSAAVVAHDAGARVLVIESEDRVGGSTMLSGGVYYAAGTSVQRAAGIADDTPDDMFEYYMTLNQWRLDPALARRLCDEAAPGLEWLISLGVEFRPEALYRSGVERVPRGHSATGMGAAIGTALEQARRARGIDLALKTRADRLLIEDGCVAAVSAGGQDVRSGAVVISTGGFGQNPDMLDRYYPEATAAGDWTWSISAPGSRGDGLALGEEAQAAIVGYNRGLLLTTPGFHKQLEVYVPGWLVYVNRDGRRFVDETAAYAVMAGVMKEQGGVAFAIFDEASRAAAEPDPVYADAFAAGALPLNWVNTVLEDMANKGRIIRAATLDELAGRAGINSGALNATTERYNSDVARGADSAFFKDPKVLRPINQPPFYAAEVRPAIVCLTSTGLRIDADCRVLNTAEQVIPGLYAAGETTGGVLGDRYIGGGNSIANAIVFGRIAGAAAAAEALGTRHGAGRPSGGQ
jgi:fumarate reductase flavoprotein subunit